MSNILAIDPGINNGIAILAPDTSLVFAGEILAAGEGANKRLNLSGFQDFINKYDVCEAVIESVSAMPKQGVSSVFRFGRATGHLEGAVMASKLPLEFVSPAKWKADMGLKSKAQEDIRARAIQRWPEQSDLFKRKKDHNRAEAALIALWYVQKYMKEAV